MAKQTSKPSGNNDTSFIRETIRPKKKKGWTSFLKWLVLFIVCGCVAGATFWLLTRFVPEPDMKKEERLPAESDSAAMESTNTETEPSYDTESILAELEKELDQKIAEEVSLHYGEETAVGSLTQQIEVVYHQIQDTSMAVVTNTQVSVDWLQNAREQRQETWALILSIEKKRVLLLANSQDLEGAAALSVQFGSGTYTDVNVLAQDSISHMAILEVQLNGETLPDNYEPAEFGSSYNLKTGSVVLAMGAPLGVVNSLDYGIVSWQDRYQEAVDTSYTILYTSMNRLSDSGFLVNLQGQVVGWLTNLREEGMENTAAAIGISNLSGMLERLEQGKAPAWLGIVAEEVPETVQEQGQVPAGLYITGIQEGSPAIAAGLQYGDIVTKYDDMTLLSVNGLQKELLQAQSGQKVTLTVMRWSREGYSEILIPVVLATR